MTETVDVAERVVMALRDTGYGYLVRRWRSCNESVIAIPRGTIRTEDEARALHRAIRLAQGYTTPGNFEKWLAWESMRHGWIFPWLKP